MMEKIPVAEVRSVGQTPHMGKRVALMLAIAVPALLVLAITLVDREPRYQGLTMGDWLRTIEGPDGKRLRTEEPVAPPIVPLFILGTNNLNLLVARLAYDPRKDILRQAVRSLPFGRKSDAWAKRLGLPHDTLASDAWLVLQKLGTNAAPVLPQLARIATRGDLASVRAVTILGNLGEPGLATIASTAVHSANPVVQHGAYNVLCNHPDSFATLSALTNALSDNDAQIRRMAADYLEFKPRSAYAIPTSP